MANVDRRLVIGTIYHVVGLRLPENNTILFDVTLEDDNGETYEVQADREDIQRLNLGDKIVMDLKP